MPTDPDTPVLRAPTPDDADALGALHHACWVEAYSRLLPASVWQTLTVVSFQARWQRWLTEPTPGAALSSAWTGDVPVGLSGSFAPTDERPRQLWGLYILAARYGSGLGRRLLDAVVDPAEAACLWVAEDNPRAQAFYRRNGFRTDGSTDTHEVADRASIPVLRMTRPAG